MFSNSVFMIIMEYLCYRTLYNLSLTDKRLYRAVNTYHKYYYKLHPPKIFTTNEELIEDIFEHLYSDLKYRDVVDEMERFIQPIRYLPLMMFP